MPNTSDYAPNICYDKIAVFTASATSAPIDLAGCKLVGIITPASLGTTNMVFQAAVTEAGTYLDVLDSSGIAISSAVSSSAAGWNDLTNIFPASVRFLKLKAGASITANITLATIPV